MAAVASHIDVAWGCEHFDFPTVPNGVIRACKVKVNDLDQLAGALARVVVDTSWMTKLDSMTKSAYEAAVDLTAPILSGILTSEISSTNISKEFGEIMISMGSLRALKVIYGHAELPLAELWKPKTKGNEGFDFHTICGANAINFGEAKYSSSATPHGIAINQIDKFVDKKKHRMDWHYLKSLCSKESLDRLEKNEFGVVAAFSLNGQNHEQIIDNARTSALALAAKHSIAQIFLVGVDHAL